MFDFTSASELSLRIECTHMEKKEELNGVIFEWISTVALDLFTCVLYHSFQIILTKGNSILLDLSSSFSLYKSIFSVFIPPLCLSLYTSISSFFLSSSFSLNISTESNSIPLPSFRSLFGSVTSLLTPYRSLGWLV